MYQWLCSSDPMPDVLPECCFHSFPAWRDSTSTAFLSGGNSTHRVVHDARVLVADHANTGQHCATQIRVVIFSCRNRSCALEIIRCFIRYLVSSRVNRIKRSTPGWWNIEKAFFLLQNPI